MPETIQDERERLNALKRYQILDTPPDGSFDRVTALASKLLKVPIAITSLVDSDRIWFKSRYGLDVEEVGKDPGLCASAILDFEPYVLNDAKTDPRSLANPLVAGEAGFRFYAGVPLTTHDNFNLGVLCVIDYKPRTITDEELDILKSLAQIIMDEMELRLASRQIHKLSKEKSHLLAVLSHEIRTPMNGVMGMAGLLQSTELDSEQKEYVDVIESSGNSLLTMLNHILDFSKMDAGKMDLNLEPFDVRSCTTEVLKLFKSEQKEIDLLHNIDPGIPLTLMGDSQKVRQILVNLVGNAVKFTKKGAVKVTVHLQKELDTHLQDVSLIFMVSDTGTGIPADQRERLFEPFTQAHSAASAHKYGGTGLGLSICKQLVELMDGSIWLKESSEKGTTFAFEIKLPLLT